MKRISTISRTTSETSIKIELNIDGNGEYNIGTSIGFFDHMLTQLAKHGKFDLTIQASGDINVDYHHLVEDVGICLGQAFYKASGNFRGIKRFSTNVVPMDDALSSVSIDISNRPYLVYNVKTLKNKIKDFDTELFEEFFRAFVNNFRCNLHINNLYGNNSHHIIESIFKAFALTLKDALKIIDSSIPSTKGTIK